MIIMDNYISTYMMQMYIGEFIAPRFSIDYGFSQCHELTAGLSAQTVEVGIALAPIKLWRYWVL